MVHSYLTHREGIMRRINYLILALFATMAVSVTACNDDDKDKDNKPDCTLDENKDLEECKEDEKPDCDDPANADLEECKTDSGFVTPDPAFELCVGQEAAYDAIKDDIAGIAQSVALTQCGALDVDTDDADEVDELNACVAVGIAATDDVEIDATCAYCTAKVVACAAANCAGACASDAESEGCLDCRSENQCDDGYEECQFGDGSDAVDCEETPDHEDCQTNEDVACEDGQTPEDDDCIDCDDTENADNPVCE